MGKVIMSGIVPLLTEPKKQYPANFADATWAEIIEACQKNWIPDTWVVGSQKTMTIDGTNYPIDIIGKNHDIYSDGSGTAPLTFQMHDCYEMFYPMNNTSTNAGGWASCRLRTNYMPKILALMPTEIQNGIREVTKLASAGNKTTTINTTTDKLFLLSEIEIFGSTTYSAEGEGTQYDYYKAGNTKVKGPSGSAEIWWERSSVRNAANAFCSVTKAGQANRTVAAYNCAVAFAFCF